MELIEALATGRTQRFDAVNVRNNGSICNLPDWAVVEVPAETRDGVLAPATVPPLEEPLAGIMRNQCQVQSLNVDAALNRNPGAAIQALSLDPLAPPTLDACRETFEQMRALQGDVWGF